MKTIKTTILAIMLIASFILLIADADNFETFIATKIAFLIDVIAMTYLWQWWGMDKYYNKYINNE